MRAAQEVPVLLVGYFWNNFHLVPIQILSFLGFLDNIYVFFYNIILLVLMR